LNLKCTSCSKAGNFNAIEKSCGVCAIVVCKNDFPMQMKALEVPTFLKIPWYDFKPNNGWALIFLCLVGLVLCHRTTFV